MPAPIEFESRVVDDPGIDPLTVYEKLRSFTPGRASYLLEALDPDHPEGRYSVVGYRVRQGGLMPPGVDAFSGLDEEIRDMDRPETIAEAIARSSIGYLSANSAWMNKGVRLFEDEGPSGHLVSSAAVMVFDHRQGSVSVAAPKMGDQVDRLLYELGKGGDPAPTPSVDAAKRPETIKRWFDDDKLQKRFQRAKPFFDDEIDELVLHQMYLVPQQGADPFVAYRALRELKQAPFGYFIDFGQSPMAPEVQLFGLGHQVLHSCRRDGQAKGLAAELHAALPHRSATGRPPEKAAKLLRKVEQNARLIWGGAVGYAAPGGEACWLLADETTFAQDGSFWIGRGAPVTGETDPATIASLADDAAAPALAAIAAAQDAPTPA